MRLDADEPGGEEAPLTEEEAIQREVEMTTKTNPSPNPDPNPDPNPNRNRNPNRGVGGMDGRAVHWR